jgi:hypothetical protein
MCAFQLLCSVSLQAARAHWQIYKTLAGRLRMQPNLSPLQMAHRSPTTTCCPAHMTLLAIDCCWLPATPAAAWHCFQCTNPATARRQVLGLQSLGSAASTLRWVLVLRHMLPHWSNQCAEFPLFGIVQHARWTWMSRVSSANSITHAGRSRAGVDGKSSRCGCNWL